MLHMTLLAYDRYQAIIQPLKYSNPNKSRWVIIHIVASFAFSYVLWLSPVILLVTTGPYNLDCYFEKAPPMTIVVIAVNILPLLAMTFLYMRCVDGLRRQFRKLHPVVTRIVSDSDITLPTSDFRRILDIIRRRPAMRMNLATENSLSSKIFPDSLR
jgi:7 transmembrane receptor (rhodopsin family)